MTDQQFDLLMQQLNRIQLENLDFYHNVRIFGFLGFGIVLGGFTLYILLKEVIKRW